MAKDANGAAKAVEIPVDLHRAFIFPNRMREQRSAHGFPKLLRLAAAIPEIPYIRLSKIERGEVFPRPDELRRIGAALGVAPSALLLDLDSPDFDIAAWSEPFADAGEVDAAEARFAVLLAAAVRARRAGDPRLTIAAIERDFGLPPVNLSRVENALKPYGRWNAATRTALLRLFDVKTEKMLRDTVAGMHRSGALAAALANVAGPKDRHERSRARIAELAASLDSQPDAPPPATPARDVPRTVAVLGAPLAEGLIAETPTGERAEAPSEAGPRAFGLKVCRATLGAGLPSQAIVIVDPDRALAPGGLAALREDAGWRLLSVGTDRHGRLIGYSMSPEHEVALDDCAPDRLAALVSAIFR